MRDFCLIMVLLTAFVLEYFVLKKTGDLLEEIWEV